MSPDDVPLRTATISLTAEIAEMSGLILSPTLSYIASSSSHSAALAAMTSASSPTNGASGGDSSSGAENGECKLLGPFALFIQGALGALALLSLIFKRWRERPQRPVKTWAFDASKQVVGSALLHIANLLMSMMSSGQLTVNVEDYQANPCSFYLLNLAIDTTIGIPILVVLLRLLTHAFMLTPLGDPPESIQSGHYGHPPKAKWWLKQSFIYFLGLLGMKFCVFIIFQLCPWIVRIGDWALRWTEGDKRVQIFFVMLFFPVVMNALQYYIIDSFIKDQKTSDHELVPNEDEDDDDSDAGRNRQRRHRGRENSVEDERGDEHESRKDLADIQVAEDKTALLAPRMGSQMKADPAKLDEYDPAIDGEGSTSRVEQDGARSEPINIHTRVEDGSVKES